MLKLRGVSVIYPDKTTAVSDLSLTVAKGENVALLGANGAGKTSLLHAVVGVLDLSGGAVEVNGVILSPKTRGAVRKAAGLLFQNPDDQLFMPLVYDDVAFGCRNLNMSEKETFERVEKTLKLLDIAHLSDRSPLRLSGGEKRLAAVAAVLAMDPDILLFDEPTAFLDHRARRALILTLKKLPHTKLIATHDLPFAAEICERAVLLKDGRVAADGPITILYDREIMASCALEALYSHIT